MSEDRDYDVVVAGGGPGGCMAALAARREGARVLLIEATEAVGGNAARSTGYLAFCDTAMQREAGIQDSVDAFLDDMDAEVERQRERYGVCFDRELAREFAERSSATYDFLVGLGFGFTRFVRRPQLQRTDRLIAMDDVSKFRTLFTAALTDAGVQLWTNARARRLLAEAGAVSGIEVERAEATVTVTAQAVVLATGGYHGNHELRRRYTTEALSVAPFYGLQTTQGDGHLMAQAVGADLLNMPMIPPLVMVGSGFVEAAIAVDRTGSRFHNEPGPYDDRVTAVLQHPIGTTFYVYDDETARSKDWLIAEMPGQTLTADTAAELADLIGCPPDGLEETIERWNATVRRGRDEEFGRVVFPPDKRGIRTAPLHAKPCVVGVGFPGGGTRVTTAMQVVDVMGHPIEGLYAAGDTVGGIKPTVSLGGMLITPALTLGDLAGRAAAGAQVPSRVTTGVGTPWNESGAAGLYGSIEAYASDVAAAR